MNKIYFFAKMKYCIGKGVWKILRKLSRYKYVEIGLQKFVKGNLNLTLGEKSSVS